MKLIMLVLLIILKKTPKNKKYNIYYIPKKRPLLFTM